MNEYQTAKIPQGFGLCKQKIVKHPCRRWDDTSVLGAIGIREGQAINKWVLIERSMVSFMAGAPGYSIDIPLYC
jgi:hypothetical protein